jgi:hypothetical protein
MVSFAYSCLDLEDQLDEELRAIGEAKELSKEQLDLVDMLATNQVFGDTKYACVGIGKHNIVVSELSDAKKIEIAYDYRFESQIQKCMEEAIEMAIANAGTRIGLTIKGEPRSHIIGITAKREKDKIILRYDDPNYFVKVKFDSFVKAAADLTKLICHGYRQLHESMVTAKKMPTIYLATYQVELDTKLYSTEKLREWAKANRSTLFAAETDAVTRAAIAPSSLALTHAW